MCVFMFCNGTAGLPLDRELRGAGVADSGDVEQRTPQVTLGGSPGGRTQWGGSGSEVTTEYLLLSSDR